jgi:hypothetical protein
MDRTIRDPLAVRTPGNDLGPALAPIGARDPSGR